MRTNRRDLVRHTGSAGADPRGRMHQESVAQTVRHYARHVSDVFSGRVIATHSSNWSRRMPPARSACRMAGSSLIPTSPRWGNATSTPARQMTVATAAGWASRCEIGAKPRQNSTRIQCRADPTAYVADATATGVSTCPERAAQEPTSCPLPIDTISRVRHRPVLD
jgi:hypothetical protein